MSDEWTITAGLQQVKQPPDRFKHSSRLDMPLEARELSRIS